MLYKDESDGRANIAEDKMRKEKLKERNKEYMRKEKERERAEVGAEGHLNDDSSSPGIFCEPIIGRYLDLDFDLLFFIS